MGANIQNILLKVRKLYHVRELNQLSKTCTIVPMQTEKVLILDNIRSAHNVGSLFRTSDGAGVSKIILGGYTPAPRDRFGRQQAEILKTSLGASAMIAWEQKENMGELVASIVALQADGFSIVALEQTTQSIPLYDFTVPKKVAYIVGNEVDGVQSELLELSDTIVEIPMRGQKESLNVAVATGILLFR